MVNQKNVVIGVDFEADGDEAIRAAFALAKDDVHTRLIFAFAADPTNLPEEFGELEFDSDEEVLEYAAARLRARVERIAREAGHAVDGLMTSMQATVGKPAAVLLAECAKHDADLLVVGTHARRGFNRLVLGSVAELLVREAPCQVLVARAKLGPVAGTQPTPISPSAIREA